MLINEQISGTVQVFNHNANAYITACTLDSSNIISASTKRQCCTDGAFEIGGVYVGTLSMVAKIDGLSTYSIRGAKIVLYHSYNSGAQSCLGTYYVTDATKVGNVYTIAAQDAVGWLDTSSYNDTADEAASSVGAVIAEMAGGVGKTIQQWLSILTTATNKFIQAQTGIPNMLGWEDYNVQNNKVIGKTTNLCDYCNSHIWADGAITVYPANFFIYSGTVAGYQDTGGSSSDTPRDFYKYLAELAGGFIYANPATGKLTLGQFGQIEWDTLTKNASGEITAAVPAVIDTDVIEFDTCEIADYTINLLRNDVRAEILEAATPITYWTSLTSPDYDCKSYIREKIEANPFLDGFAYSFVIEQGHTLYTISHGLWYSFYGYGGTGASGYTVRPFKLSAHPPITYHLGQKVRIRYKSYEDDVVHTYDSIITSINWAYRGGLQLSCGGADSRVMADCINATKGDKVRKEALNRCRALEKRVKQLGG